MTTRSLLQRLLDQALPFLLLSAVAVGIAWVAHGLASRALAKGQAESDKIPSCWNMLVPANGQGPGRLCIEPAPLPLSGVLKPAKGVTLYCTATTAGLLSCSG